MELAKTILVPIVGAGSEAALDAAVGLAAELDANIHLLHVMGAQLIGTELGIPCPVLLVRGGAS